LLRKPPARRTGAFSWSPLRGGPRRFCRLWVATTASPACGWGGGRWPVDWWGGPSARRAGAPSWPPLPGGPRRLGRLGVAAAAPSPADEGAAAPASDVSGRLLRRRVPLAVGDCGPAASTGVGTGRPWKGGGGQAALWRGDRVDALCARRRAVAGGCGGVDGGDAGDGWGRASRRCSGTVATARGRHRLCGYASCGIRCRSARARRRRRRLGRRGRRCRGPRRQRARRRSGGHDGGGDGGRRRHGGGGGGGCGGAVAAIPRR